MTSFRRISMFTIMAVALLAALPVVAQTPPVYQVQSGALTAANASCTATACVSIPVVSGVGSVTIQLAGTFTATAQFEGSVDGTNYVSIPGTPIAGGSAVTSASAAGVWTFSGVGLRGARVRLSARSSGTVNATVMRGVAIPPINPVTLPLGITPITGKPPAIWAGGYSPAALTSGTDTTGIANQQWLAPVWVPVNMTITGVSYLIGTAGGTDKAIVALYDSTGTKLANSTTAGSGTTVGTLGTLQSIAFTAPYFAQGPALYWISVQTNGTNAKIRTIPIGPSYTGTNAAGGAAPAATITPPTTFTADVGPVAAIY